MGLTAEAESNVPGVKRGLVCPAGRCEDDSASADAFFGLAVTACSSFGAERCRIWVVHGQRVPTTYPFTDAASRNRHRRHSCTAPPVLQDAALGQVTCMGRDIASCISEALLASRWCAGANPGLLAWSTGKVPREPCLAFLVHCRPLTARGSARAGVIRDSPDACLHSKSEPVAILILQEAWLSACSGSRARSCRSTERRTTGCKDVSG